MHGAITHGPSLSLQRLSFGLSLILNGATQRKRPFENEPNPDGKIMKLVQSLVTAAVFAVPAASFAQSNQPITRAQVRAELIQLEKAGYNPASDQTQYPKNIEAAQARVNVENGVSGPSYGSSTNGTSNAGSRAPRAEEIGLGPIYARP
jgi:hypothetical protein